MIDLVIQRMRPLSGNEIYVLREDVLPFYCGGSKARIVRKLLADATGRGATALVGYGNSRSNLCRALAMGCAEARLKCVIVSPSDDDGTREDTTNGRIARLCGATILPCVKSSAVADVIQSVMDRLCSEGEKPYYIFGDRFGKGNERVLASAYDEVGESLCEWQAVHGVPFDRIALAVGTGATYAGLAAGLCRGGCGVKLTGFTIARQLARCVDGVKGFGVESPDISEVALCGGYGRSSAEELAFLADILRGDGVIMDPVYAGKAYWGLSRYLDANGISGERILFVHTGSLPIAFDRIAKGAVA